MTKTLLVRIQPGKRQPMKSLPVKIQPANPKLAMKKLATKKLVQAVREKPRIRAAEVKTKDSKGFGGKEE